MLFLDVLGVFDYAGPDGNSRFIAARPCGLPTDSRGSAPGRWFTKLNRPAHRCLYLRFARRLATTGARLEVKMESLLLSCRDLSSPTTCRLIPAYSVPPRSVGCCGYAQRHFYHLSPDERIRSDPVANMCFGFNPALLNRLVQQGASPSWRSRSGVGEA